MSNQNEDVQQAVTGVRVAHLEEVFRRTETRQDNLDTRMTAVEVNMGVISSNLAVVRAIMEREEEATATRWARAWPVIEKVLLILVLAAVGLKDQINP